MRNDQLYLADILDAIDAIERFTAGVDESRFVADELVIRKSALVGRRSVVYPATSFFNSCIPAAIPRATVTISASIM
jgi:hypothetical protein